MVSLPGRWWVAATVQPCTVLHFFYCSVSTVPDLQAGEVVRPRLAVAARPVLGPHQDHNLACSAQ